MARYRQFLCAFWDDPDVEQMNPKEKLVFAYLFTNKLASESGIYPISVKKISFATGLKQNMTEQLLKSLNNVMYDFENQVVFVINMLKHNKRGNPELIAKSIIKDIETIHTSLWHEFKKKYARYLERFPMVRQTLDNHLSNVGQPLNEDEDRDKDSNKRKEKQGKESDLSTCHLSSSSPQQFMDYFNQKTGKKLKLTNDRRELINKKLTEGYTLDQLEKAVDNFILDDWEQRHKYIDVIYCIGKQRGKPDNLERWLYFTPADTKEKDPITVSVAVSLISRNQTQTTMQEILNRLPPEYLEEFVIILRKKSKYLHRMYLHVSKIRAKEGS